MANYKKEFERLRLINIIEVMEDTIDWYHPQIGPIDCGWMHTTISGLNYRIDEAKKELKKLDKPKKTNKHRLLKKS
tara:strand:- start:801 stop:1028 length:228 start_codon:yes stop_codon:yes gene_type:complete